MNSISEKFEPSSESLKLLQVIEATNSQVERSNTIFQLAHKKDVDSSRVLIELWDRTKWTETKLDIIKALGVS